MSLDAHLIHRCTIQRATTLEDAYHNQTQTWAAVAENVACRLVVRTQTAVISDTAEHVRATSTVLLLPAGTDVAEGDRVTDLVYEDAATDGLIYLVRTALTRRAGSARHVSCDVEALG